MTLWTPKHNGHPTNLDILSLFCNSIKTVLDINTKPYHKNNTIYQPNMTSWPTYTLGDTICFPWYTYHSCARGSVCLCGWPGTQAKNLARCRIPHGGLTCWWRFTVRGSSGTSRRSRCVAWRTPGCRKLTGWVCFLSWCLIRGRRLRGWRKWVRVLCRVTRSWANV